MSVIKSKIIVKDRQIIHKIFILTFFHYYQNYFIYNLLLFKLRNLYPFSKMSEINQRTQKLLILAGDEGPTLQSRDFKKVIQVIVNTYIAASKPAYEEFIQQILPAVVRRIPLKQHIYAGLTAQISRVNPPLSLNIVKNAVNNLQKDLNALKLHQSINGILYLSELMNLEKLNSQCFFDIIDDIVVYLENCKNSNHRSFFIQVFSRTLYNFCFSLNQKVHFEFKKLLQRAKKYCNKNTEFSVILQSHQKGTVNDGSIVSRIFSDRDSHASTQDQIQQNIKLKINVSEQKKYTPIEYHLASLHQSDKLYQQFQKNEGPYHMTNIQQIIELMKQNGQHLTQKLIVYINHQNQKSSFIQRFVIDLLIGKAIKSKDTIVQSSILIRLIKQNKNYAEIIHTALQRGINAEIENFDLSCQMKFAEVVTYVVNNWPVGGNQMTDIALWDWDKFIAHHQVKNEEQAQKSIAKRNVLLSIICFKMVLLNENFKVPVCLKKYAPPEDFKSPAKYKLIQQMQRFQKFQQLLKAKADSEQVLVQIKSESEYEIFLEALFQKTSQSHTHLQVLINRYEKVFLKYKEDYDWSLFNTIRSYWSKSLFHRLLYLQTMIERGYVDFASYVKYIAKVETGSEEEGSWVKMELNQLHSKFAQRLTKI